MDKQLPSVQEIQRLVYRGYATVNNFSAVERPQSALKLIMTCLISPVVA